MRNYFEGRYYKLQKKGETLALIPGRSRDGAFIQVITNQKSYHIPYPLSAYQKGPTLRVGNSRFGQKGLKVDIEARQLNLKGAIRFHDLTPLSSDIMGPFRFFPMQCRHSVFSMNHALTGNLTENGHIYRFTGGKGYLEGDRGISFPDSYTWVHCNAFSQPCSVMASLAKIPFMGLRFWGVISVVWLHGREYRLATYRGGRIVHSDPTGFVIEQRDWRLLIRVNAPSGLKLFAPERGKMRRIIHETPICETHFRFEIGDKILLDETSPYASFEYAK